MVTFDDAAAHGLAPSPGLAGFGPPPTRLGPPATGAEAQPTRNFKIGKAMPDLVDLMGSLPRRRELDRSGGRELAREGMERSAGTQERLAPGWAAGAYRELVRFAQERQRFTGEEAKAFAYREGLERPRNEGAWGGVVNRAARAGVIEFDGYEVAGSASRHCAPNRRWRSKVWRRAGE